MKTGSGIQKLIEQIHRLDGDCIILLWESRLKRRCVSIEHCGVMGVTSAVYSRGTEFKSRPGLYTASRKIPRYYIKTSNGHFVTYFCPDN
jgi:hypothetical protein